MFESKLALAPKSRSLPLLSFAAVALLCAGCGDENPESPFSSVSAGESSDSGITTIGADSSGDDGGGSATASGSGTDGGESSDGGSSDGDSSGGDSSGGDGGIRLDVPDGMTGAGDDGGSETEGCRGVDFLFVIDNSGSMEDEQANLIASFPGFIQSMQGLLSESAQSFRVMVVDTDGIGGMCTGICQMFPTGFCNGISCQGDACEINVGGGNNRNRAIDQDCGLPNGRRYADSDETNIASAFNCTGRVGTTGSGVELVADSMLGALSPTNLGAGGCNESFIREDAVLVVVVITDEDDSGSDPFMTSQGGPADWYNALSGVKNFDPNAVVVLGLLGDIGEPGGICQPYVEGTGDGAEPAPRLREFVNLFGTQGLTGSVCAPQYTDFFDQAVGLIDTTCDEFVPPAG